MSVRDALQTQTLYPTVPVEPEKKRDAGSGSRDTVASVSTPRMDSRRASTRVPPNPRKKNAAETAGSSYASTEPRQVASSASSSYLSSSTSSTSSASRTSSPSRTSAAKTTAPASEVKSPAASKAIAFNRDEKISKYLKGDGITLMLAAQANAAYATKQVKELVELQRIRKEDPAKLLAGESPFVTVGKEYLANFDPIKSGSDPSATSVASCFWLIGVTLAAEGDNLKQFFELALAFREKGLDLPSLIVNDAIEKRNTAFLSRLREAYPDTNLGEIYRTKF